MTNSILVLGDSGNLGNRLISKQFKNYRVITKTEIEKFIKNNKLDITNLIQIEYLLNVLDPNVIINCAGISNVDYCDVNPEHCKLVNMLAPINISRLANKLNKKFIQISTDHYASRNNDIRDENCYFSATNMYGYSKLISDVQIELANKNALIIRTNFFGYGKNNLFKWIIDKINNHEAIDGYLDIFFNPVSIDFLCNAIERLLESDMYGVINVACDKTVSKHHFLSEIAALYTSNEVIINRMNAPNDKGSAVRPRDMSLVNDKFRKITKSTIPSLTDMILYEIDMIQRETDGIIKK